MNGFPSPRASRVYMRAITVVSFAALLALFIAPDPVATSAVKAGRVVIAVCAVVCIVSGVVYLRLAGKQREE
jgi:Na+-translocating ferredoxin:NAD+ oxidoreductase RnfD subunit